MSVARRIAKNTTILLIANIISYVLGFFITIYSARYLGAEGLGVLSTALAWAALLSIFTELGLGMLTVREVARDITLASKYMLNTSLIKLILASVTIIFTVILAYLAHYPLQTTLVIYIITASYIISAFSGIFNSIFQAHEKMEYLSFPMIINGISMLVGVLIAVSLNLDVIAFAFVYLISSILVLIYGIIVSAWKFTLPKKVDFDFTMWRFLIAEALPITITSIFAMLAFRVDTILLSLLSGSAAVGWYNAAYRLMEVLMFLPSVYITSIFPLFSRFHISSQDSLKYSYVKSFKYLSIVALPIAVGTTLLADQIILFIYKAQFAESIIALQILIWSIPIIFLNYILGSSITAINKQRQTVKIVFFGMVLNIILNIIFIPKYGFVAAAISTVLTELFTFIFCLRIMDIYGYKISLHKILVKPIIASAVMGLFIIFVKLNLFIEILISAGIYFGVLFILKAFSDEDIDLFKQIINLDKLKKSFK